MGATGGVVPGGAAWVTNVVGVGDVLAVPADAPPCIMHISIHNGVRLLRDWSGSQHTLRQAVIWVSKINMADCQHQPLQIAARHPRDLPGNL